MQLHLSAWMLRRAAPKTERAARFGTAHSPAEAFAGFSPTGGLALRGCRSLHWLGEPPVEHVDVKALSLYFRALRSRRGFDAFETLLSHVLVAHAGDVVLWRCPVRCDDAVARLYFWSVLDAARRSFFWLRALERRVHCSVGSTLGDDTGQRPGRLPAAALRNAMPGHAVRAPVGSSGLAARKPWALAR